jgi:hypothetical protein
MLQFNREFRKRQSGPRWFGVIGIGHHADHWKADPPDLCYVAPNGRFCQQFPCGCRGGLM